MGHEANVRQKDATGNGTRFSAPWGIRLVEMTALSVLILGRAAILGACTSA